MQELAVSTIPSLLEAIGFWLFGVWDESLKILCVLVIIDYLTGFSKGFILGKISSQTGWKGIFKKILVFVAVIVSHLLDKILFEGANIIISDNANLNVFGGGAGMIRNLTIWFYAVNEAISIVENLQESGVKIPRFMQRVLRDLEERLNNSEEEKKK